MPFFYIAMHVVLNVVYPFDYICLWILSYYVHPCVVPFAYASSTGFVLIPSLWQIHTCRLLKYIHRVPCCPNDVSKKGTISRAPVFIKLHLCHMHFLHAFIHSTHDKCRSVDSHWVLFHFSKTWGQVKRLRLKRGSIKSRSRA